MTEVNDDLLNFIARNEEGMRKVDYTCNPYLTPNHISTPFIHNPLVYLICERVN